MLPSGYIQRESCITDGSHYIDTGIYPSSNVKIEMMYSLRVSSGSTRHYIFGARNTNSNTSAGQITVCRTFSNGCYLGYGDQNTLISSTKGNVQIITEDVIGEDVNLLKLDNKECTLAESIAFSDYDTSTVATFTGNRTMYLFGMNNAGAVVYAPGYCDVYYCKIWENGTLVRDYVPCTEESTNYTGMYDLVGGAFHVIDTGSMNNGYRVIDATTDGNGRVEGANGRYTQGVIRAIPNDGYVFKNWQFNGTVISNENTIVFDAYYFSDIGVPSQGTFDPVATFIKKTDEDAVLGFKLAVFGSLPAQFSGSRKYLLKAVCNVRSASISNDGTQKATSSFVIDGTINAVQGDYVYVYSQLGKKIYVGLVESVKENTIVCVEINAVFDKDVLLSDNTSRTIEYGTGNGTATITVPKSIISYALHSVYLPTLRTVSDSSTLMNSYEPGERFLPIEIFSYPVMYSWMAGDIYGDYDKTAFPLWNSFGVANLYTKLTELFNDFNIYVDNRTEMKREIIDGQMVTHLQISFFPRSALTNTLVIGDNLEEISNISITEESGSATYLVIFNSTGSTIRARYLINSAGQIEKENGQQLSVYSIKVVTSDDNINTLVRQNLTSGKYNHKITFDVSLGLFKFEDFAINKKVNFYYKGKLYESVITALKYDIHENEGQIKNINVTLGMVRNNLTSKLNLGKVKK